MTMKRPTIRDYEDRDALSLFFGSSVTLTEKLNIMFIGTQLI
jgi:hypothetical protein